jgi:hypothetical protein
VSPGTSSPWAGEPAAAYLANERIGRKVDRNVDDMAPGLSR